MSLLISDDERELEVPTFLKTAKALEMSKPQLPIWTENEVDRLYSLLKEKSKIVGGRKPIWFKDLQNELTQKEINTKEELTSFLNRNEIMRSRKNILLAKMRVREEVFQKELQKMESLKADGIKKPKIMRKKSILRCLSKMEKDIKKLKDVLENDNEGSEEIDKNESEDIN